MKQLLISLALALSTLSVTAGEVADSHDKAVGYCMAYLTLKSDYRVSRTGGRAMNYATASQYRQEWQKLLKQNEQKAIAEGRAACSKFESSVP